MRARLKGKRHTHTPRPPSKDFLHGVGVSDGAGASTMRNSMSVVSERYEGVEEASKLECSSNLSKVSLNFPKDKLSR